jgi:adenylate cyclase
MAYTVLGDAVNLGSRLEGLTKNYGVNIIVSESTKNGIPEFIFRELDLVRVKGKNEPVAIV